MLDNRPESFLGENKGMMVDLVTILERSPGGYRPFDSVRDKVRQEVIARKSAPYFQELERRYPVEWKVLQAKSAGLQH